MIRATISIFILILCLTFLVGAFGPGKQAWAEQASPSVVISSVEFQENAVNVLFSEPYAVSYTISKPADPYTAVVEMSGVGLGEILETVVSDKPGIMEINLFEVQEPMHGVRIEVMLESPVDLVGEYNEGVLTLTATSEAEPEEEMQAEAEPEEEMQAEAEPEEEMQAEAEPEEEMEAMVEVEPEEEIVETKMPATVTAATAINDIGFDYKEGHLMLIISGNGSVVPENVFSIENKIIIDVPEAEMMVSMPDEVVSPVSDMRYGVYEGKLRIVVDLKREVEFIATSVSNKLLVSFPVDDTEVLISKEEIEAAAEEEEEAAAVEEEEETYEGKLVSLDFQDADVKPIIKLLVKDVGGMNIVLHPNVKGTITIDLKDVPWDLALDIILKQSGLEARTKGNIMRVAPSKIFEAQDEVAETTKEVIYLEYMSAEDMKTEIEDAEVLRGEGKILIDERQNAVIIYDLEENIQKAKNEVIAHFDTEEHRQMQVYIEAKIVEVSSDYASALGIRWGGTQVWPEASGDQREGGFGINTPVTVSGPNATKEGLGVSAGLIEVGTVSTAAINISLDALEAVGKTNKLANPRVFTMDGELATITQGVQIPLPTITGEGIVGTELKNANLSLSVTPTIRRHKDVHLKVAANNDTPVVVGDDTGINTQSVSTQAIVSDGETLVLGGIYSTSEAERETRVPILGKIPLLGWLFKTKTKSNDQKELLIFITPTIVR
jgi:type IV pilus secretin PilQ/predicted competence protein